MSLFGRVALPVVFALAASTAAHAQQAQWQATANEIGSSTLVYGVPQTDDITVFAQCIPDMPGLIDVTLYLDVGTAPIGQSITVYFGADHSPSVTRTGTVIFSEMFGAATTVPLSNADGIWTQLSSGGAPVAEFAIAGGQSLAVSLSGANVAIPSFLASCNVLWNGAGQAPAAAPAVPPAPAPPVGPPDQIAVPAPAPVAIPAPVPGKAPTPVPPAPGPAPIPVPAGMAALPGPLYLTGNAAIAGYSAAQNGSQITVYAPQSEVMGTNATANYGGVAWMQVVDQRGSGITAWVDSSRLTPSTGGASEYQNLNSVANLVLRSAASPNASVVGTVPPGARGIYGAGQQGAGYVLVTYNGITGWASHAYLLPFVPALVTTPPPGVPGKVPTPAPAPVPVPVPPGGPGKVPATPVPPTPVPPLDPGKVPATPIPPPGIPGKIPTPGPQPGKVPGGSAANPSELYLGRWFDVGDGSDRGGGVFYCLTCTLDFTDQGGGTLAMMSSDGWVASVTWGADGDTLRASGSGTWTAGKLAGQTFDIEMQNSTFQLDVTMFMTSGDMRYYQYVRPGLG